MSTNPHIPGISILDAVRLKFGSLSILDTLCPKFMSSASLLIFDTLCRNPRISAQSPIPNAVRSEFASPSICDALRHKFPKLYDALCLGWSARVPRAAFGVSQNAGLTHPLHGSPSANCGRNESTIALLPNSRRSASRNSIFLIRNASRSELTAKVNA